MQEGMSNSSAKLCTSIGYISFILLPFLSILHLMYSLSLSEPLQSNLSISSCLKCFTSSYLLQNRQLLIQLSYVISPDAYAKRRQGLARLLLHPILHMHRFSFLQNTIEAFQSLQIRARSFNKTSYPQYSSILSGTVMQICSSSLSYSPCKKAPLTQSTLASNCITMISMSTIQIVTSFVTCKEILFFLQRILSFCLNSCALSLPLNFSFNFFLNAHVDVSGWTLSFLFLLLLLEQVSKYYISLCDYFPF